jgi:hypothetical protein
MFKMDFFFCYINSRNKIGTSETHTNFTHTINMPAALSSRMDRVCCIRASIPKSFYNIPDGKNTFILVESDGGDETLNTITITPGNYDRRSLQTWLSNELAHTGSLGATYAISYPDTKITGDTGKFTFTRDLTNLTSVFRFGADSPYEQLGFPLGDTSWGTDSTDLECPYIINLQPESTLFIHSNLVASDNFQNDILQEIYSSSAMRFDNITFECQDLDLDSKTFSGLKSNVGSFYITDENNNSIDTLGINVLITLMFYNSKTFHQAAVERMLKASVLSSMS